jgi:hypothetical protein
MSTVGFHNPDRLSPNHVQENKGWRLIIKNELDDLPPNAQFWSRAQGWLPNLDGPVGSCFRTYRIKVSRVK